MTTAGITTIKQKGFTTLISAFNETDYILFATVCKNYCDLLLKLCARSCLWRARKSGVKS